jgi:penicillin-binding protein 1C
MNGNDLNSDEKSTQPPTERLRRILKASADENNRPADPTIPPTGTEMPEHPAQEPGGTPVQPDIPADAAAGSDQPDVSELPTGQYLTGKNAAASEPEQPPAGETEAARQAENPDLAGSDLTTLPVDTADAPVGNKPASPVDGADLSTAITEVMPVEPPDSSEGKTVVIPAEPKQSDAPTQPVKVQPRSQEPTIPPARAAQTRPSIPLPQRVDQVDVNATRVTPSAYGGARPARNYQQNNVYPPQQPVYRQPGNYPPAGAPPAARGRQGSRGGGNASRRTTSCLLRGLVAMLFLGVVLVLIVGSFGVYQYFRIASTLPSVDNLRNRASQFETTRILDRNGNVLYEILDPNAGRRTYVPLKTISPYLIAATLATEDKEFWSHPGFDPVAIVRALWQNYTTGDTVSGASTVTQQLARMLLLSPTERTERTVQRKAREIVLAAEITRRYSKDDILELYLNESYYGNLSYGIEAAAETYFNTTAGKLTLAQASFLGGLPQAPAVYDIYTNRDATLNRQKQVLTLMFQTSQARDCIDVGPQANKVCVDVAAAQQAAKEIENYNFSRPQYTIRYPHWVNYIRSQLEKQFDAQTIYRSGFTVYTTLDPTLQDQAQSIVKQQVDALADRHVTDGSLVAIRPSTGEILAMVGSADFFNKQIAGEVNMAISPRQPGSSIKPLTYTAAFEKGWNPATLIWDVPSEFPPSGDPNDPREPYRPQNYDGRFHGPVTLRTALANSYNIPAVKALQYVGIYDNPSTPGQDGVINFARRMGITTLNRPDYGLSLTLGGGDVTVLDMTSAFGVFANTGVRVPPVAITKITDYTGSTVYEYQAPDPEQVIRPEHAYLISSILSDNEARTPAFGPNSVLNLPFQAAVKTGTTNDYRDNWTIGYTPDLVTGVWVGNADYTPMINTSGVTGAAPIWSQFMQFAVPTITAGKPNPFSRPPGIVDRVICSVSGIEPSEFCPSQRSEVFAADQPPLPKKDDLWQKVNIDTWTGLRVSAACSDFQDEKFSLNVTDTWAQKWIRDTDEGRNWADQMGFKDPIFFTPSRDCRLDDSHPTVLFAGLTDNQTITSAPMDIYAVISSTKNFDKWRLEWGTGDDPVDWKPLVNESNEQFKNPEKIFTWDLKDVPAGKTITLRIYLKSTANTYAERKLKFQNMVPTATPTPTATATETSEPTETPTATPTHTAVPSTHTSTPTPTETPAPAAFDPAVTQPAVAESGSPLGGIQLPQFLKDLFSKANAAVPTLLPAAVSTLESVPKTALPALATQLPEISSLATAILGTPEWTATLTPTPTCVPVGGGFPSNAGTATWTPTPTECVPTSTATPVLTITPARTKAAPFSIWDWLFGKP